MLTVIEHIFIKSEPDREHTHHIDSCDDLPALPEENFTQKIEVTIVNLFLHTMIPVLTGL